jgi:DNA-binding transcriptional regulator YiaG
MAKHTEEMPKTRPKSRLRVVDCQHQTTVGKPDVKKEQTKEMHRIVPEYDATALVGLKTLVCDAAIERTDEQGDVTVELPKQTELLAAAAIVRCLMPIRLRGSEIKAMRRIMKKTLAELAGELDERTAPETVSRWESEAQPMGGYAEKLLRLLVCERLQEAAPGIDYNAGMIADLKVQDPWRADRNYEVPAIVLVLIHMKEQRSGSIIETWDARPRAA